jgi:hypothetical protein
MGYRRIIAIEPGRWVGSRLFVVFVFRACLRNTSHIAVSGQSSWRLRVQVDRYGLPINHNLGIHGGAIDEKFF